MNLSKQTLNAHTFLIAAMLSSFTAQAETAFTYQGQLSQAGLPANGQYDMNFTLFDALTAGQAVGTTLAETDITVADGVFDVLLDFGDTPFNNAPRWLEIEVRETGGSAFSALEPRQRVGASPFAIETLFVAPGAVDTAAIQDGAVTRAKIGNDAVGTAQIENNTVTSNDIRDGTIKPIDIQAGLFTDKEDLYEVRSTTATVGSFKRTETVACTDENDLAIWAGCDVQISGTGLVFNAMFEYWNSNTDAASLTCTGINTEPSIPADFEAVIWCVAKP